MNLFVNEGKTRIQLFGKIGLVTDEIVKELFNREIRNKNFKINNLQFKVYGEEINDKMMFIVKEIE